VKRERGCFACFYRQSPPFFMSSVSLEIADTKQTSKHSFIYIYIYIYIKSICYHFPNTTTFYLVDVLRNN